MNPLKTRPLVRVGVVAASLFAAIGAGPSAAQDETMIKLGKEIWLSRANCPDCHGWAADGVMEDPQAIQGANLRETTLTEEQLVEVISCGRPATEMPYFSRLAWDRGDCYGMTTADIGADLPDRGDNMLADRFIRGLAAFITAQFVGKPPPTYEECVDVLGPDANRCPAYPKAGN